MDLLLYQTGAKGIWRTAEESNMALLRSLSVALLPSPTPLLLGLSSPISFAQNTRLKH